jgi:hypothetical protein
MPIVASPNLVWKDLYHVSPLPESWRFMLLSRSQADHQVIPFS